MNYTQSNDDHTMFFRFNPDGRRMILVVCVDDVIIIGDYADGIKNLGQDVSKVL